MHKIGNINNVETLHCNISTKKTLAFTLVELIIVITILAILATIGFMSYQSYTLDARDANRITSLKTMSDGLEIYQAKNSVVPSPDAQVVNIHSGRLLISTQGYAGSSVLQKLKASDIKDPSDDNYYTYIVNSDKTKYQLLGMLEKDKTLALTNNILNETYARDYTSRYAYTTGNKVGIFFSGATNNTPIQETMSGNLDLTISPNSTKVFKVMFSNSTTNSGTLSITGANLPSIIQTETNSIASTALNNGNASSNNQIFFANTNSGVIKYSSDGGNTFSILNSYGDYSAFYGYSINGGNLYIDPYTTNGIYKIGSDGSFNIITPSTQGYGAVGFENNNTLFAIGGSSTIWKTINNGTNWIDVDSTSGWTGVGLFTAVFTTNNAGTIVNAWCNTSVTPRIRYYYLSNDYGTTWTDISSNFFTTGNSSFAGYGEYINGAFYIYAPISTTAMGLYKSTDGLAWTLLGLPSNTGVFKTDNYGGGSHKTRIIYYNGNYYGYTTSGVYQSNDMLTWTLSKTSPTGETTYGLTKTGDNFIVASYNSATKEISLYDLDFNFTSYTNKRVIVTTPTLAYFTLDNFISYK